MKDTELISRLEKLSGNLLWMSESDYPWKVILWENTDIIIPEGFKDIKKDGDEVAIEIVDLDDFFAPALKLRENQGDRKRAEVKQYQTLVDFLKANLQDIKVYRIGSVEIDVYIIGKTESGNLAGLSTTAIET